MMPEIQAHLICASCEPVQVGDNRVHDSLLQVRSGHEALKAGCMLLRHPALSPAPGLVILQRGALNIGLQSAANLLTMGRFMAAVSLQRKLQQLP